MKQKKIDNLDSINEFNQSIRLNKLIKFQTNYLYQYIKNVCVCVCVYRMHKKTGTFSLFLSVPSS